MEPQCIPYTRVPKSSALLVDYLYHFDRVAQFYNGSPFDGESYRRLVDDLKGLKRNRAELAEILERQNKAFGCAEPTLANIRRLSDPARTPKPRRSCSRTSAPLTGPEQRGGRLSAASWPGSSAAGAWCCSILWTSRSTGWPPPPMSRPSRGPASCASDYANGRSSSLPPGTTPRCASPMRQRCSSWRVTATGQRFTNDTANFCWMARTAV